MCLPTDVNRNWDSIVIVSSSMWPNNDAIPRIKNAHTHVMVWKFNVIAHYIQFVINQSIGVFDQFYAASARRYHNNVNILDFEIDRFVNNIFFLILNACIAVAVYILHTHTNHNETRICNVNNFANAFSQTIFSCVETCALQKWFVSNIQFNFAIKWNEMGPWAALTKVAQ